MPDLKQNRIDDAKIGCNILRHKAISPVQQHPMTEAPAAFYDVTPDGQRFLMVQVTESEQAATQINVVLNWFEELKQRVPTGN